MRRRIAQWRADKALRREVYHLAWPVIVELLLITLVSMISTVMIGQISVEALGAVGVVNMTVQVVQAALTILSIGVTVVVARLSGQGDRQSAQAVGRQALLAGLVVAVLLPLALFAVARPMMALFLSQADAAVVSNATDYFLTQLPGLPFFIINMVISGIFRGVGEMRRPMVIALLVNVLAAGLGYLMIFTLGMEIRGAGLALSIARTVGGALILLSLLRGTGRIVIPLKGLFHFEWPLLKRVLRVGVPSSVEQVALMGGNLLVQIVVALLPPAELAANQMLGSVVGIPIQVVAGFCVAVTTFVGQNLGAGKPQIAERATWQIMAVAMVISNILFWCITLFIRPLAGLYSSDMAVINAVIAVMPVFAAAETLLSPVNVLPAALRGGGDIMFVTWSNILGVTVLRVAGTYLLSQYAGLGLAALYITLGTDFVLRTASYVWRFRQGKWKTKRV